MRIEDINEDIVGKWNVGAIVAWTLVIIFIGGPLLALLGSAIGFFTLPFFKFGKKVDFTQQEINTVYDAQRCNNINAQYQQFKTSVPALRDEQIPNAEQAVKDYEAKLPSDQTKWSQTQQETDAHLQTDVTGLKQQLSSLQAEYGALTAREDAQPCLGHIPTFIDLR